MCTFLFFYRFKTIARASEHTSASFEPEPDVEDYLLSWWIGALSSGWPFPKTSRARSPSACRSMSRAASFFRTLSLNRTKEIVVMIHVALKCLGVRLVLLISDRKDLDS